MRFAKDRQRWRHWLYVATRRYGVSVLNYIVTSNHIHLLVRDLGRDEISATMQLVAGRTAQEYNTRKRRRGAFWEDRYHATAIQDDEHFIRCMTYIDLNMVRARAVDHPGEWNVSGYTEIQSPWQRKGVIDFEELCRLFGARTTEQLAMQLKEAAEASIGTTCHNSIWTKTVGVGNNQFLKTLRSDLGPRGLHRNIAEYEEHLALCEDTCPYFAGFAHKNAN